VVDLGGNSVLSSKDRQRRNRDPCHAHRAE
jgi:hypothetical protein